MPVIPFTLELLGLRRITTGPIVSRCSALKA